MTNWGNVLGKIINTIETERLLLRGITEDDAAEIVEWRTDPAVYKYFKNPHKITIEEHLKWYYESYLFDDTRFDWLCTEKDTGEKIGVFGLIRKGNIAEVNYLLSPSAQHKGYAAEGIQRLIQFSVEVWDIHQIIAEIHKDNKASIALVERLGFSRKSDGEFVVYLIEK